MARRWRCYPTLTSLEILAGVIAAILVTAVVGAAQPCTRTITQCPCTISSSGKFTVQNALISTSLTHDCITVKARKVNLDLAGNSITGAGNSTPTAGIHVMPRASRVTISGGGATISQFNSGIMVEGKKAEVSGVTLSGNQNGLLIAGNLGAYSSFDASGNSNDGVLFSAASRNLLSSFTVDSNTAGNGVEITSGSNRNQLSGFSASTNGSAGVLMQRFVCGAGMTGRACHQPDPSGNKVTGGDVTNNGSYGIAILNGHRASITGNTATSNPSGDLFDANSQCDHNKWFGNTFGIANRNCID